MKQENKSYKYLYERKIKCIQETDSSQIIIGNNEIILSSSNNLLSLHQNETSLFDYKNIPNALLGITGNDCCKINKVSIFWRKTIDYSMEEDNN